MEGRARAGRRLAGWLEGERALETERWDLPEGCVLSTIDLFLLLLIEMQSQIALLALKNTGDHRKFPWRM